MDRYQHRLCLGNVHWIPPWYDLPEEADTDTHNPWLIMDSSTKQTAYDVFVKEIGIEELRRRVKEFQDRMRDMPERSRHLAA